MVLIAANNLQFILEFAILMQIAIMILFNLLKISLSRVMLFSLVLAIGLTALFTFDMLALFIPALGLHEFTHTYGPIALMAIVSAWAALSTMSEVGIGVLSIKRFIFLLIILITIVGGLVHRDFLILWIIGLIFGFYLISKSFRQKSFLTAKRVIAVVGVIIVGFTSLELLSRILGMTILSPVVMIRKNITKCSTQPAIGYKKHNIIRSCSGKFILGTNRYWKFQWLHSFTCIYYSSFWSSISNILWNVGHQKRHNRLLCTGDFFMVLHLTLDT